MLRIISHSEKETMNLGARLVHFLSLGDIVCLFGDLGAGKTILVKGMAEGLGINKDKVISPSFVLVREYVSFSKTKVRLYHLDLFRLNNPRDILSLGYEEYLYNQGICVIEWAQRLKNLLPAESLNIELAIKGKATRFIQLIAKGKRYRKALQNLKTRDSS